MSARFVATLTSKIVESYGYLCPMRSNHAFFEKHNSNGNRNLPIAHLGAIGTASSGLNKAS